MSYLVLARKYRPSTFAEVVGQDHVTRTLGNAFATGRVHHAFLFCGPRGCGKTTLARIVGKALNCEAIPPGGAGATAEPCGVCAACTSIGNGSAVDYQEMDGASNRGIDAIRELTEAVRYQPAALRKKVYVIDEVHMLTTEAFNALLKTLEEPPPHVTFVLATTEPHKLPNTILSRCQRYDFKLVPASRLAQHLTSIFAKERLVVEPGAVSLVVRESGGSVRDALSLCDQLISYVGDGTAMTERHVAEVLGVADRSLTRTLVRALAEGDAGAALAAVESAIERGVDEVQLARAIVRYLRDLSVLQVAPGRRGLVDATEEELAELAAEAAALDRSRTTQMFERMLRCCDELGKTLQPRLVLDCALIDVATIEPLVPLGDLIDRLTELEGRLAGKPARPGGGGGATAGNVVKDRQRSAAPPPVARPPVSRTDGAPSSAPGGTPGQAPGHAAGQAPGHAYDVARELARSAEPSRFEDVAADRLASAPDHRAADGSQPIPVAERETSGAISIGPSGPVPRPDAIASGSGPQQAEPAPRLTMPSGADEALRAWNDVLGELETLRKFSLLGPFQHARVMQWTPELLELGFPVDVHSMGEMAMDSTDELRTILRSQGPAFKNLRVTVRLLDAGESSATVARSVLETSRERTSAERSRREAEARAHPITKHVLQTFGAQIKEIKTDV
ncbi:MAG TPA: DNA polymerase III subunit gamma/tau [Kofleriaceae bacterium]|nr:DNA polymerase III subunit gamma/tau [Kofleriaceae bacterium]